MFGYLWTYTHSTPSQHNRHLWPYVREVNRDEQGEVTGIKLRFSWDIPLTSYVNVPRATVPFVHLILSGPSIKEINYDKLELSCVMGVNGAIALRQRYDIKFHYYTIIDHSFVRDRLSLVKEIVTQDLVLFARVGVLKEISLRIPRHLIKCQFVAIEEVDTPAYQARPTPEELLDKAHLDSQWKLFDVQRYLGFSANPLQGIFSARTVAYDALQLLVWLNFTKIYIHGLDMNDVKTEPRFYEQGNDCVSSTLHKNFAEYIEPSFRQAGELLRDQEVEIYNLSLESALSENVFPKLCWKNFIH